jgi:hypothetical protein
MHLSPVRTIIHSVPFIHQLPKNLFLFLLFLDCQQVVNEALFQCIFSRCIVRR